MSCVTYDQRQTTSHEAGSLITQLMAYYPLHTANIPDVQAYTTALCSILVDYPLWAGQRAVMRAARTIKWPPSGAELHDILHEETANLRRLQPCHHKFPPLPAPVEPRECRKTYDELLADAGGQWLSGHDPVPPFHTRKTPTEKSLTVQAILEKYSITKAQWDMIPNECSPWKQVASCLK